jgi:hypothetical protein
VRLAGRCSSASPGTASCCSSASRTPPPIISGRLHDARSPRHDAAQAAALRRSAAHRLRRPR